MLVTFSSKHSENLTFFGEVATKLLKRMGHSGIIPGALLAEDVPAALAALQASIASEPSRASDVSTSLEENEPDIRIRHRALPLIKLLQNAIEHHSNVMWE